MALIMVPIGLGILLLFPRAWSETSEPVRFESWDEVSSMVSEDARLPVPWRPDEIVASAGPEIRLTGRERANLTTVITVKLALPMIFVCAAVTVVILVIALIAVSHDVLPAWQVKADGASIAVLSARVSAFLGAFSVLYFLVEAQREPPIRAALAPGGEESLRIRVAVLLAYRTAFCEAGRAR